MHTIQGIPGDFESRNPQEVVVLGESTIARRAADVVTGRAGTFHDLRRVLAVGIGQHVDRGPQKTLERSLALDQLAFDFGPGIAGQNAMGDRMGAESDAGRRHFADFVGTKEGAGLAGIFGRHPTRTAEPAEAFRLLMFFPTEHRVAI